MSEIYYREFFENKTLKNTPIFDLNGFKGWARLVDCYDGDTITIIINVRENDAYVVRIRLEGIDSPERRDKDEIIKKNALESRDMLAKLLCDVDISGMSSRDVKEALNKTVYLIWVECGKNDKYGRVLGKVFKKPDHEDIGNLMIGGGFAKVYC